MCFKKTASGAVKWENAGFALQRGSEGLLENNDISLLSHGCVAVNFYKLFVGCVLDQVSNGVRS